MNKEQKICRALGVIPDGARVRIAEAFTVRMGTAGVERDMRLIHKKGTWYEDMSTGRWNTKSFRGLRNVDVYTQLRCTELWKKLTPNRHHIVVVHSDIFHQLLKSAYE